MKLAALAALVAALTSDAAVARPRLGVIVVFDQLRVAELERYEAAFGAGGFGGLDGARFDAFYAYAGTETAPGHATLATGANPWVHGIAANRWWVDGAPQYVVDDPAFPVHGAKDGSGRSAHMLLAPTLGDTMKAESVGRARVVTLSHKDRSAILTAGPSADLAVWYDPSQGRYTSSTAYVEKLPKWLEDKGAALPAHAMATGTWSPLPPSALWATLVPADDRRGEAEGDGLTRTFPHHLKDAPEDGKRNLYRLMPQSIDDLFTLALTAVDEMQLGKDDEPDLLVISCSTTDAVGHAFGPDSLEQLDTLRRADQALRRFVAGLETRVGRRGFALVLSSDHGSSPLPAAVVQATKVPGGAIAIDALVETAEKAAQRAAPRKGKPRILGFSVPQLFVDLSDLDAGTKRRVLTAVIDAVEGLPAVANVYDLSTPAGFDEDALGRFMRQSAVPGRHAPLFVRQKPRFLVLENARMRGSDHAAPYTYDQRVPLIVAGPGVRKGRFPDRVDPRDLAPTLAYLLRVPPPDMAEGKPIVAALEVR